MAKKKTTEVSQPPFFIRWPATILNEIITTWDEKISTRKAVTIAFFGLVSSVAIEVITLLTNEPGLLQEYGPQATLLLIAILHGADNWARHNIEAYGGDAAKK